MRAIQVNRKYLKRNHKISFTLYAFHWIDRISSLSKIFGEKMNPFINPITGIPFIKHFLFDSGRLKRMTPKQIEKYRDKAFKRILKYAYTVPVYHNKYKKAGIHPEDLRGIKDITKLPFITKKDFVDNYPDRIIPPNYNKKKCFGCNYKWFNWKTGITLFRFFNF